MKRKINDFWKGDWIKTSPINQKKSVAIKWKINWDKRASNWKASERVKEEEEENAINIF